MKYIKIEMYQNQILILLKINKIKKVVVVEKLLNTKNKVFFIILCKYMI